MTAILLDKEKKDIDLTLCNYAVHKPHGEAKVDEVMQVVHLEEEAYFQCYIK